MKNVLVPLTVGILLAITGCSKEKENPTFMFWNFRKEVVQSDYHIPDMTNPKAAAYIQHHLKRVPGYMDSSYDIGKRTMTVSYASSTIRKMNFEEAIANAGFAVNNRPANPNAKIPEGIE